MLDANVCYRAHEARDPRFDGQFYTAVLSTGIYCRPICPARTPKRENVTFYPCAAAAQAAGFRACRRCHPEAAPGSALWRGTQAIVSRALRLIEAGVLDEQSVGELAQRLGVSERHLRRLFSEQLGSSPLQVALTRRVHFAKALLDQSQLSITDVAFSAGFNSLRRFNDAVQQAFGQSPSEIRRPQTPARPESQNTLRLQLAYRPPFDWSAALQHLAQRAVAGVERVSATRYQRIVCIGDRPRLIDVSRDSRARNALQLAITPADPQGLLDLVGRVRQLFDLDADPGPIAAQLEHDPYLGPSLRSHPGLRVIGAVDPLELAVRAILCQGVRLSFGISLINALVALCDQRLEAPLGDLTHRFPSAAAIADADLQSLPTTAARRRALQSLARAVRDGELRLDGHQPVRQALDGLRRVPGIGPWTAELIAMRGLCDPDAFPSGDSALQSALPALARRLPAAELERIAERWRPWRAYAAVHLWQLVSDAADAKVAATASRKSRAASELTRESGG